MSKATAERFYKHWWNRQQQKKVPLHFEVEGRKEDDGEEQGKQEGEGEGEKEPEEDGDGEEMQHTFKQPAQKKPTKKQKEEKQDTSKQPAQKKCTSKHRSEDQLDAELPNKKSKADKAKPDTGNLIVTSSEPSFASHGMQNPMSPLTDITSPNQGGTSPKTDIPTVTNWQNEELDEKWDILEAVCEVHGFQDVVAAFKAKVSHPQH